MSKAVSAVSKSLAGGNTARPLHARRCLHFSTMREIQKSKNSIDIQNPRSLYFHRITLLYLFLKLRVRMKHLLIILNVGILFYTVSSLQAAEVSQNHRPQRIWMTNDHSLFVIHIPRQQHRYSLWQKINPIWWLGNADEPVAPDWYRPGGRCRNLMWHLRNPCHNFDCYVIGFSDKRFIRVGRFPEETFNPNGGWNWGSCRSHGVRFPYISYIRGGVRAYCGWRPGGAFGTELKLAAKADRKENQPARRSSEPATP